MATIRTSARIVPQRFNAAIPKRQLRRLHITGANATPSNLLTSEPATTQSVQEPKQFEITHSTRQFNTSRSLKAVNDSSTIDLAYMPQFALSETTHPEIVRIPLLPDNDAPPPRDSPHQGIHEPVIRPTIETASADSTGVVSAMSEVTDNHAMDIDVYDLTKQVGKAATGFVGENVESARKTGGMVREVWNGFVDDLLGKKGANHA
ncbi:hypothetical protein MMC13_005365 [Lambiella insularis]|nr:hypothetical protein [Lambiella insularis]